MILCHAAPGRLRRLLQMRDRTVCSSVGGILLRVLADLSEEQMEL